MPSLDPKRPKKRRTINKKILIIAAVSFILLAGVAAFNVPTNTTPEENRRTVKQNITPLDAATQFNPQNAIDFMGKSVD